MDPNRKIANKFTKKFDSKVISRQYFHRKTRLKLLVILDKYKYSFLNRISTHCGVCRGRCSTNVCRIYGGLVVLGFGPEKTFFIINQLQLMTLV